MPGPSGLYKQHVLNNLPAGITSSGGFFFTNSRKFNSYKRAQWYNTYLRKFGDVVPPNPSAQRVIIVTDYAGDCDDAAALAIACRAHSLGEINLLGIVVSSTVATSAPGVYAQLMAYNMHNSIPVYAYQGTLGSYNNTYTAALRDQHGIQWQTRTDFPNDVFGLRTLLANAPDNSVKMIDIGAPVSTARLLDSIADPISSMTGMELVAAKVVGLWGMAGEFTTTRVEYNANRHVPSTQRVYHDWPTPIYAHGAEVGANLFTGPAPGTHWTADPVKHAFDAFNAFYNGTGLNAQLKRQSWDPACLYHAIYGEGDLFSYGGQNGTITVDASGTTVWSNTPGNRSYVSNLASNATIENAMQAAIDAFAIPGTKPVAPTLPAPFVSRIFPMTEGTGTTISTQEGSPQFNLTDTVWNTAPTRLTFSGTGSRGMLNENSDIYYAGNMILSAVIRSVNISGTRQILSCNESIGRVFQTRTASGVLQYVSFRGTSGTVVAVPTATVVANVWTLVTFFVGPTSVDIRQDGNTIHSGTFPERNFSAGEARISIGARGDPFNVGNYLDYFAGNMAAVAICNGTTAPDINTVENQLRTIATSKGITLP